ncbi:uncharacterized protein LOC143146150 [Ptiloglossa arizonensis]|uniref:uncharacterized protein LOC143146150 n=1 Tax=Ptiloglossa arizonensis TaxID=3350558 RepID=UPI003FA09085
MKRGTKCIAQTINLSNPESCIRPKKIQKLVGMDAMQPCPRTTADTGSYWTSRPVTVKICSRRDVQRTCQPKLCDCPSKTPPTTGRQKLCWILLFLLKSGIAAGLVYWTHSEGLWGSSADVEDLYYRILSAIAPVLPNGYDDGDIELPRIGELKYRIVQKYNRAVFTIMNCILVTSNTLQKQLQKLLIKQDQKAVTCDDSDSNDSNDSIDASDSSDSSDSAGVSNSNITEAVTDIVYETLTRPNDSSGNN